MQKHIADSSASYEGGLSTERRLFKVSSGQYAGRIAALLHASPATIKLSYSDYPYTLWSEPETIVSDSADYPFDAVMVSDNNIHLVYTLGSNNDLVSRKLTFSQGLWAAGSLNTIYNADDNYFPSITIQQPGRLWVSWSRLSSGSYYVNAKHSDDWGANWGTGPSSFGYEISSAASSAYSKIVAMGSHVYAIYTVGGAKLSYRRKHFNVSIWEDEDDIATGSGYDRHFDVAVSRDSRLGVAFDDGKMRFREFDGNGWSGLIDIDTNGGEFPQLRYFENYPYLIYLSGFGDNRNRILYSRRLGTTFSTPQILDPAKAAFDKVFCYNAITANYSDLTSAAADSASADIYHPDSLALLKSAGDVIYFGMPYRYHYLRILLSTAGMGGEISWQYYNGREWTGFEPSGGSYDFISADKELLLWDDYSSIPSDWQKYDMGGNNLFWVRAAATSAFDTGPVGSQITSVSNIDSITIMEE